MDQSNIPILDVLVDGYISHSFGIAEAEKYFKCLLKSNTISASHCSGIGGDSFIVTSVPPQIPQLANHYDWVLDRKVVGAGSVVPQTLLTSHSTTDRRRYIADTVLQMPIFFLHTNGILGIPLGAAVAGHCDSLVNARFPAPLGDGGTTHIRIGWPGYLEFRRQIQIRDETSQMNPVSLSKFAQHVGRCLDAFLKVLQPDTTRPVPRWFIGERGIQRDEIVIIGAINVSVRSWIPILQLRRYIGDTSSSVFLQL